MTDTGPDSVRLALQAAANSLSDAVHVYANTRTSDQPPAPDLSEQVGDYVDVMRKASALLGYLHRAAKSYRADAVRSDNDTIPAVHLTDLRIALDDASAQLGALLEDLDTAHGALSHLGLPYDDATDPEVGR